jgi:hypothetical protein
MVLDILLWVIRYEDYGLIQDLKRARRIGASTLVSSSMILILHEYEFLLLLFSLNYICALSFLLLGIEVRRGILEISANSGQVLSGEIL